MKNTVVSVAVLFILTIGCQNTRQRQDSAEIQKIEQEIKQLDSISAILEKQTAEIDSSIAEVDQLLKDIE